MTETASTRITATRIEPEGGGSNFAAWLTLSVLLALALNAALWLTGFEGRSLTVAVDEGTARIEKRGVGEMADDVVRKAIQMQRSTLPFWTTLLALTEFVVDPVLLIARAIGTAVVFSALAALTGRPIRFEQSLGECSACQLYWVVGLAVNVALRIGFRDPNVETSAAIFLSPGVHHASIVVLLRRLDPFAIYGWLSLAWLAWRRGQANLIVALFVCALMAATEILVGTACELMVGGAMRLSILPENYRG